jgi:hypothetical protein
MTPSTAEAPISAADVQVTPDASTLDRYIGYYLRNRARGCLRSHVRTPSWPWNPLVSQCWSSSRPEADFAIPKFDLVLCFEQIEDGAAKRLVIWQRGTALRLARTDASLRVPGPCPAQARARRPPAQGPLSIEFWAPTYACEIKWPV